MPWDHVLARWEHLAEQLCADFRHLEAAAVRRFRGDREKLVVYLADTHDLTLSEARDTLEDWLTYTAARIAQSAAA